MRSIFKRILAVTLSVMAITVSNASAVSAADSATFTQNVAAGNIWVCGHVVLTHWDTVNRVPTGTILSADVYTSNNYALSSVVNDKENAYSLCTPLEASGWPIWLHDHVNSRYSGTGVTGLPSEGVNQLWLANPGDMLQLIYYVPDGYIVKFWFCKFVDQNAFCASYDRNGIKKGYNYYSVGLNMFDYGKANTDDMQMCCCWPHAWGNKGYMANGDSGRVLAIFGEDRTQAWDAYFKADGTVLFGDYDLYTGQWTTLSTTVMP